MEAFLASNPYFSAGFGLIGVGAGLSLLRTGGIHAISLVQRRLLVTVEIASRDPAYAWFLKWSADLQLKQQQTNTNSNKSLVEKLLQSNQLSLETSFRRASPSNAFNSTLSSNTNLKSNSSAASFALVAAPGRHVFRHANAFFLLERARDKGMLNLQTGAPFETITITTLARDRHILLSMLEDAKSAALKEEEGKTIIYTSYGPEWRPFGNPRRRRDLRSVVLDDGVAEKLTTDLHAFLRNGAWYHDRGIPYRRGYLLHGPPGSGKTSFIQAVAGDLGYSICLLNLSERGMTDDRLAHLLANAPPQSMILLEDVDAAFARNRDAKQEGFQSMVTFSGLLNALDGVAASEERLVFMTTNHIDRLDPALIRPGRADVIVKIDNVTDSQARRMFLRFYPGYEALANQFVIKIRPFFGEKSSDGDSDELLSMENKRCSPAALQGHFTLHRDSPEDALLYAEDLVGKETSNKH
ncbi:hypothetical protein HK100_002282 [Physocladia obscura]|uniref:Mitochondrial chaperone BCS1 n=1 Tax=Physocladia obscura TaxID=109957 RepID=A0AAD5XFJ0_9FUNG|nr:hypothetical protein HK100_002282 [Physocladia obscura]